MDSSRAPMDKLRIIGPATESVYPFLDQWFNEKDYIVAHTSGSTGKPKEIRLLKSDMILSAQATCRIFGIDRESTLALPLSTDYIAGKMMVVRTIVSGAKLWVCKPSNCLSSQPIPAVTSLMSVVPSQIPDLLENGYIKRISKLLIGGAPLPSDLERQLIDRNVKAFVSYGMTETCSHVALRRIGQNFYSMLTDIGYDVDSRGCMVIRSDKFSFTPIVTNDIVEPISPVTFKWLGRYDNVINSGGVKISPEEIESELSNHLPFPFYISSRDSDRWGSEAILVVERPCPMDDDEITAIIDSVIPKFKRPKDIIRLEKFRYTANNKLIREKF